MRAYFVLISATMLTLNAGSVRTRAPLYPVAREPKLAATSNRQESLTSLRAYIEDFNSAVIQEPNVDKLAETLNRLVEQIEALPLATELLDYVAEQMSQTFNDIIRIRKLALRTKAVPQKADRGIAEEVMEIAPEDRQALEDIVLNFNKVTLATMSYAQLHTLFKVAMNGVNDLDLPDDVKGSAEQMLTRTYDDVQERTAQAALPANYFRVEEQRASQDYAAERAPQSSAAQFQEDALTSAQIKAKL